LLKTEERFMDEHQLFDKSEKLQLEEIKFQPTMSTNPEYLKKLISRTFLKKSKHAESRSLAAKAKVAKRKAKRKN
jgi:hypothetical protein